MKLLVSWSSGKDSAWMLHTLRQQGIEPAGLLTDFDGTISAIVLPAVPLATLTGWQFRSERIGSPDTLLAMAGGANLFADLRVPALLVAFLRALTDKIFFDNPRQFYPLN